MRGLIGILGSTLGSAIGWWLGATIGIFTAVCLSAVGTGIGLYAARRFMDEYLP